MELEGEVWPPLEENQGAWDVMARAPMAVTFTSLPRSRRDSVQTFLQCRDRTTQAKKRPNVWTAVGSWRDFGVDWCQGAVATTPSSGRGKTQIPCHHKCLLQTLGQPLQGLPPRASEPPLAAASAPSSPHRSTSSMTISTFHLDLSPQSDSSEVSVSAEAPQVVVPVRGEKVFKQGK